MDLPARFRDLHREGILVMPNAWDTGSARVLQSMGFAAVATTSSGFAASLGLMDQQVTLDDVIAHVRSLVGSLQIPVSVDAEAGYADSRQGVAETVERLAVEGAAGVSIEDYEPGRGLLEIDEATRRVASAADAAARHGVVLTARAENHLYGADDLDDTIARLRAYQEAGADVVYAPGPEDLGSISRIVESVSVPVNVLLTRNGPSVAELAAAGVRRVSTGGAPAFTAYGALAGAARELLDHGTSTYADGALSMDDRERAFGMDHEGA